MGKLKVLPAQTANMIAAGEVVQRPASVVKELLENSLDAGASKVDVILTDAGRTLIQVIDNGCGMSASDAVLCFERHATSKIDCPEDLGRILTFGFRGEALPSIASISEVTLKTRCAKDETGTTVNVCGEGAVKTSPATCPVGTNISVRNIFFNIPARRKFLKNDNVELKHCIQEFTRIAITRPDTEFSLSHNGRDLFVLKKAKSLKFRILDLLGSGVVGEVVDIEADTSVARIRGFAGRPQNARKTLGNQYFFANGRFFRSPYLHKAVMKAYEDLMPDGLTPSYFIFLDIDAANMDVNVSPTKTEIKFEDEAILFQTLYACIRETLGRNSFGASIDFETEGAVSMPQLGSHFEEYKGPAIAPSIDFDPDYDPFNPDAGTGGEAGRSAMPAATETGTPSYRDYTDRNDNYGALFEQKSLQCSRYLVIKGKYILTPVMSGVMAVNIQRATERIIYERYLKALSGSGHVTQTALFPEQVQVGVENMLIFEDNRELLTRLGFDISPFGRDTVVVNGVPEGYSCENGKAESMVRDLIVILSEDRTALPSMMTSSLAEKFAVSGAANSAPVNSPAEAQNLIDLLFSCDNSELTSRGQKIVSILSIEELDKKFA